MFDKMSLVLWLIHQLDCSSAFTVTHSELMKYYLEGEHCMRGIIKTTLDEQEIQDALDSLVKFSHLMKLEDGSYEVKPLGAVLKGIDTPKAQYLEDIDFGKMPVGEERIRKLELVR